MSPVVIGNATLYVGTLLWCAVYLRIAISQRALISSYVLGGDLAWEAFFSGHDNVLRVPSILWLCFDLVVLASFLARYPRKAKEIALAAIICSVGIIGIGSESPIVSAALLNVCISLLLLRQREKCAFVGVGKCAGTILIGIQCLPATPDLWVVGGIIIAADLAYIACERIENAQRQERLFA